MTFTDRWGIQYVGQQNLRSFANRVIVGLYDRGIRALWCGNPSIRKEYYIRMGHPYAPEVESGYYYRRKVVDRYSTGKYVSNYEKFESSILIKDLQSVKEDWQFAQILESLYISIKSSSSENVSVLLDSLYKATEVAEMIPFKMVVEGDSLYFLPLGAGILDDHLVSSAMKWLEAHPISRHRATQAFQHYSSGEVARLRNMLDDLRVSLEQLLKDKFGERNLPNQKSYIGRHLASKGFDEKIVSVYNSLFSWFDQFNNENVKHKDREINTKEAEYVMYLTFSLMYALTE